MNELKLNVERFQKTIDFLKTLDDSQFDYSVFVAKSVLKDDGNICGTTCCVAGWIPTIFGAEAPYSFADMIIVPEIQSRYHREQDNLTERQLLIANSYFVQDYGYINLMMVKLIDFYGFSNVEMVDALFYGSEKSQYEFGLPITPNSSYTNLNDVILLFETFLEKYKSGEYDEC